MTCVALLTAAGWWGWSDWRAARPGLVAIAVPAEVEEILEELAEWQNECQAILNRWDSDGRANLVDQLGPSAADTVERCRRIVSMRPQEWATD